MSMALLLKWEDEGLDDEDEAIELAEWIVETGLVNSVSRYGEFAASVLGG